MLPQKGGVWNNAGVAVGPENRQRDR